MPSYDEDVWSNEILDDDDEATIKLKQRLSRAEAELERTNEELSKNKKKPKKKQRFFGENLQTNNYSQKEKKHSSLVVNPNAKGLARFGYNEKAHEDMKNGKGYFENLVENPKARMAFYVGVSIACIALIFVEVFLL